MPDKEMIERCAIALHDSWRHKILNWQECSDQYRQECIDRVVLIIKAMREPTEKMLALGPEVQAWPEIIDCIINEQ